MKKIPPNTINLLIEVGSSTAEDGIIFDLLTPIKNKDFINRLHGDKWRQVSENLNTTELVALIKGLTLAERLLRWSGGSVSAVIWTYRELQRCDRNAANKLADWILQKTRNPYVPFGSQNHGAKSFSEYQNSLNKHQDKINKGIQNQKESEKLAAKFKEVRASQREYSSNHRNTEVRENFINHLSRKNLTEQLIQLAGDQEFSVEFYPTKIANQAKPEFLNNLDDKLRIALLKKLKGKHKGPWGKFKRNLLEIYRDQHGWRSTPWDRKPWFH